MAFGQCSSWLFPTNSEPKSCTTRQKLCTHSNEPCKVMSKAHQARPYIPPPLNNQQISPRGVHGSFRPDSRKDQGLLDRKQQAGQNARDSWGSAHSRALIHGLAGGTGGLVKRNRTQPAITYRNEN
ncbi:hypothetical protein VOLCADRAFT_103608 [Volvox carteri f. nagariensis]|uniref:Uncharacterized protein n=1 Tax=Volvox carteri f. nagariensis TaxID=3068 RepID=D8TNB6_VOLCA|nr:uncharacterized protein VOLCADRAFT_103608 [Volvox carteri f. nagariensis]EFJ50815.1 hypothetical protein VOLCADRAFT_103608 [Volvox carteri f. nagariensis]|eukprot:XP_002947827.1 hypothetical protein VOLCADRAFT_103608 [Volvox carteri f. nagariensis]